MHAVRYLVAAGAAGVVFSSLVGFGMLIPMQPWGKGILGRVKLKPIGSAHLDWIILGLMLGLAAGVVAAFELQPPRLAVGALIAGAWANPLPYVFRAVGIDAFSLAGPPIQRIAASLGLASSLSLLGGWLILLAAVAL